MTWNDKRPMAPHLQIYRLPLTAWLSILHRGTGAVLYVGLLLVVAVLYAAASGEVAWRAMQTLLSSWLGQVVVFGFVFSLYYHLCNGLRHLLWDTGKGLSLDTLRWSGWLVLGGSVSLTLLTYLLSFLVRVHD